MILVKFKLVNSLNGFLTFKKKRHKTNIKCYYSALQLAERSRSADTENSGQQRILVKLKSVLLLNVA